MTPEGWADCFAPDGVFDGGPRLQASGHDGLVAFMERLIARDIPAVHWTNNIVIEGSGDSARTTLYLLVVDQRGDARARATWASTTTSSCGRPTVGASRSAGSATADNHAMERTT